MESVATTLLYLQAESLIIVYKSLGLSASQASLSLIPVGIGCLLEFLPRFYDHRLLNRGKERKNLEPEDKLFSSALGAPILAVALWWVSWSVPPQVHTHWVVFMLALVPAGFALNDITFTLQGCIADSYTIYANSAFAEGLLSRSILIATVLPFTRYMYTNITANSATSVLAAVASIFCVSPYFLLKDGKRMRRASPFAHHSLETYTLNQNEDDMSTGGVMMNIRFDTVRYRS